MNIKIRIRRDDIHHGSAREHGCHPVELAVKRVFPEATDVQLGSKSVAVWREERGFPVRTLYHLSKPGRRFVERYDKAQWACRPMTTHIREFYA